MEKFPTLVNFRNNFPAVINFITLSDSLIRRVLFSVVYITIQILNKLCVFKWQDYAMEPDEKLIRNAAHLMVSRLAGRLANVTF